MLNLCLLYSIAASLLVHNAQLTLLQNLRSIVKLRLPIRGNATRGTRQKFSHLVCFILLFTDHAKSYVYLHYNFSRVIALPRIGKRAFKPFST